jgi:hypothetical protein
MGKSTARNSNYRIRFTGYYSAVGLDLEWPLTLKRIGGVKEGKVALVQLCDADIILLIHVSKMKRVYFLLFRRGH